MPGWIKLDRQIQDHWVWKDKYSRGQAWVDLIMLANYEDKKTIHKGKVKVCKRGDVNLSVKYLAERWGWNWRTVKSFLNALESDGMITSEYTTNYTTITLVNYDKYQLCENEVHNEVQNALHNGVHNTLHITNKEKNIKKDKKYDSSFSEFWKIYPRKQDKGQAYKCYLARLNDGYSEDQLLTACKNYAAECEKNKTEQKYIKHGATFLSINEPFLDYLGDSNDDMAGRNGTDEEQHNRELDEHIARIEAGEFDAEDEELRRIWDD
jgi:DNA-binding transcriptional regulator YhcF (GntR family)